MSIIEIRKSSDNPLGVRLSNDTRREFFLESIREKPTIRCNSLEGFFQGLKEKDPWKQKRIFLLAGTAAYMAGKRVNETDVSTLYFGGESFDRHGHTYFFLRRVAYDSAYHQDPTFKDDLLATGNEELLCSVAGTDSRKTILTEPEILYEILRLRSQAHLEAEAAHPKLNMVDDA
ncbi:MAG: hypothetical protein KBD50_00030 [Candidatus Pacebacteria bacterium]|nr:hypothetical protein [Candidatus Paceibacterota bacterium]